MIIEKNTYQNSIPIQIRMSDLDPFIHVNNGTQCHYFDFGRSSYLTQVLQMAVDWKNINLVLAHIALDFILPIVYEDAIICESKVYELGTRSFKMIQQLREVNTDEIKTVCKSVICGFDRHTQTAIPINAVQMAKIKAFEKL